MMVKWREQQLRNRSSNANTKVNKCKQLVNISISSISSKSGLLIAICALASIVIVFGGELFVQCNNYATINQIRNSKSSSNGGAAGLLLLAEPPIQNKLNVSQPNDLLLGQLLDQIGPDMKPASGFEDPANITLEISQRAWQLMHEHALKAIRERIEFIWPTIEQILIHSNVSSNCLLASERLVLAASQLESWSIQLLNSWGSFPASGLFEGTYGDIGSYHGCINVPENAIIKHAHYCTIAYKPVVPTRRDYELIVQQEPIGLLRLFDKKTITNGSSVNYTSKNNTYSTATTTTTTTINNTKKNALADLIDKAQYSHYIYYKLGTCFPIDCTPIDVQRIARYLGRRSFLISGPVKCHSKFSQDYEQLFVETKQLVEAKANDDVLEERKLKRKKLVLSSQDLNNGIYIWKPHMTRAQLISLIVICSLFGLIISITLVDLICNYMMPILIEIDSVRMSTNNGKQQHNDAQEEHENENDKYLEMIQVTTTNKDSNYKLNGNLLQQEDKESTSLTNQQHSKIQQQINNNNNNNNKTSPNVFMQMINDCSLITSTREFLLINSSQSKNDISCINGLRCITMSWIIVAHTMQYNDWSAFARTHEIETHLRSLINQPLFNASYLVDTFFFISGLLTSFSAFRVARMHNRIGYNNRNANNNNNNNIVHHPTIKQLMTKFSCSSYLIGRYLRLTPQILFVSLLFILLPLLVPTGGPHWYTMTGEYSENCSRNWWINLIHMQAFYKSNEMCNFVCWWISVDMFYHLFALLIILSLLKYGHTKVSLRFYSGIVLLLSIWQASQHYQMNLPPNLLSTIPQVGQMWSQMTLDYFWRPISHTFPFLFGFYMGYAMAQHEQQLKNWFSLKRALFGWSLAIVILFSVSYGTYYWVVGVWAYTSEMATLFNIISQLAWSLCLGWIIVACHFEHGGPIQRFLSCKLFIILGKASYIVYLSHFLVLFAFFGSQNLLLEPTQVLMLYVILGNVCLSMLFGSMLCITFELPWLKLQRRIMRKLR